MNALIYRLGRVDAPFTVGHSESAYKVRRPRTTLAVQAQWKDSVGSSTSGLF